MSRPVLFWEQLTNVEKAALYRFGRKVRFEPGQALMCQGERSVHAVVLLEGAVRIVAVTQDGREAILALRAAGDLIGERAGLNGGTRVATVTAIGPVTGLSVPWPAMSRLMVEQPGVNRALLSMLSVRLNESDRFRIQFGGAGVTARVAGAILDLVDRAGAVTATGPALHGISQEDIASFISASRESVSRSLNVLRKSGAVHTGRLRITVTDIAALRRAAE